MTKKQKVWLVVFLAMFIVPEILWSPVGNSWYSLTMPLKSGSYQILRNNFLHQNVDMWEYILYFQCFGLLFSLLYLIINRKVFGNKFLYFGSILLLSALLFITFFSASFEPNINIL